MFPTVDSAAAAFREIVPDPSAGDPAVPPAPREARLPRFLSPAVEPSAAIARHRVLIVGVGAVGRNAALQLSRLQIGSLAIADPGAYKPESILTQAVEPGDLGERKALNTARACRRISPGTRVLAFDGEIQTLGLHAMAGADVVLLATDNLLAEVEVGQRCRHLGIPLIHAAVHGDTLVTQVRVFSNRAGGPCPFCGFTRAERAALDAGTTFSCDGKPGSVGPAILKTQPTVSTAFLCSLAADLAVAQVVKLAAGLGEDPGDTVLEYSFYNHRAVSTPLRRRPDCPVDHEPWRRLAPPQPLSRCTPTDLLWAAGHVPGDGVAERAAFTVGDLVWVTQGVCARGHRHAMGRFVLDDQPGSECRECGETLVIDPFHAHRPVRWTVLGDAVGRPLAELAGRPPLSVAVRVAGRSVLFLDAAGEER